MTHRSLLMKWPQARSTPRGVQGARGVQSGLALLEVLISVTLLAIGALAVLVVNGSLIAASTVGHQRAEAALLAQELIVMVTTDPTQAGCYATAGNTACASSLARQGLQNWQARVRARIPGVLAEGVSSEYAADQTFTVTVQWRSARSDQTRNLRLATHLGS